MTTRQVARSAVLGLCLALAASLPVAAAGGMAPGHSASSPGSPFNEPGINSTNGGTGGQHYSETSQYDVACFQVSQP